MNPARHRHAVSVAFRSAHGLADFKPASAAFAQAAQRNREEDKIVLSPEASLDQVEMADWSARSASGSLSQTDRFRQSSQCIQAQAQLLQMAFSI
jgi:hypothetical protein